jgi:CysZ protein
MTTTRQALALPRKTAVGFFRGLTFVFRGAKYVYFDHLGLVRYWALPVLVTMLALGLSLAAVAMFYDDITQAMWSNPGGEGWVHEALMAMHGLLAFLVAFTLGLFALLLTIILGSVIAAPFNARLGEVIDERVTGHAAPAFSIARVLADVARALLIEVLFFAFNTVLFVVSLAFPPAITVLSVVGLIGTGYYFAMAYLELPLAARDVTLRDRLRFYAQSPMATLGYGTGLGIFLFVPLINLLFMPAAVAGAVLLHAELEAEGRAR